MTVTPTVLTLTADAGTLTADAATRTITGRIVAYGARGNTSAGPTVFAAGSIGPAVPGHVALLLEHDRERPVGYGTALTDSAAALDASFHVPPGPLGDQVLADAAAGLRTGLSVGVEITAS